MAYPQNMPFELWISGWILKDSPKVGKDGKTSRAVYVYRTLKIGIDRPQMQYLIQQYQILHRDAATGRIMSREKSLKEALQDSLAIYSPTDGGSWAKFEGGKPDSFNFIEISSGRSLFRGEF